MTVARAFPASENETRVVPAVWVGILAASLPDVDVLLPPVVTGQKEEFMLFHRGWSHTLLIAPLLAVVAVALVRLVLRVGWGHPPGTSRENKRLWQIALVAVGAHLFLDAFNDFGLHLLAPLDSSWRYGDTLYMAEPFLWAAMLPLAILAAAGWKRRAGWILVGLVAFGGFAWLMGPIKAVPPVAVALAVAFAQRRHDVAPSPPRFARIRSFPSAVAVGVVLVAFVVPRFPARASVRSALAEGATTETLVELSSTAAPANPLCWRVVSLSLQGDLFISREAFVSLLPSLVEPMVCYPHGTAGRTAPLVPSSVPGRSGLVWKGEFRSNVRELLDSALDCRIAAALRFHRVPFFTRRGHLSLVGDLRYDLTERRSWAELELANSLPKSCPPKMWRSPIQEILDAEREGEQPGVSERAQP